MKKVSYLFSMLTVLFFICISQVGYAQSSNINGIYIGAYSLNFNHTREAKLTIQIPSEFRNNFIGWIPGSIWPSYGYGITGFSIQPCQVSRYEYLGSEINIWVRDSSWDGQEKIQLIIDTNKPNDHQLRTSYYFLYADINIMNLD